jgi:hypothetical protein
MLGGTSLSFRDESRAEGARSWHCSCGAQFDTIVADVAGTEVVRVLCPACGRSVTFSSDGHPPEY